ncbi:NYN domain-containing protein [Pseudogemmobacter sonorensis]|uniref:NYN domain-containing protein n=1 Tax=Pseudogemmobacter sonorensis TaxID=2989681 RepID=UPI00367B0234
MEGADWLAIGLLAALLALAFVLLRLRSARRGEGDPAGRLPLAVIDGSNVMHWRDGTPALATVRAVVETLRAQGYKPGVIFDANAGYKLMGRYQDDADLARAIGMPARDVLVVPKGQQADPFLLDFARDTGAVLISNDRFRDRIEDYPALATPGRIRRGGWRDGRIWLERPRSPEREQP